MCLKWKCCLLFSILVSLTANHCFAEKLYKIDFEQDGTRQYALYDAVLSSSPGVVLSGSRSLLEDFTKSAGGPHDCFCTTDEVKIVPGSTYHMSFRYKILDRGSKETVFFSKLECPSEEDITGLHFVWNRENGAEGTIHRLFNIDHGTNWSFVIGVFGTGSLLIDDVEIERCETDVPGIGLPVKSGPNNLLPAIAEIDALNKRGNIDSTLNDMLVVWCDEGSGGKITSNTVQYAKELNPDFVDWSACGPLAKDFGVRTSMGGPEYQEYYKVEGPAVWDNRYEIFGPNGFSTSITGCYVQDESWGEGGYFTCHNAPGWHNWFIDELVKKNQPFMGMCQDNIGGGTFYKGFGCFCPHCLTKFGAWLKSRYSESELKGFGIADIDSFSYPDRVHKYGLWGNKAINDPITREYIKFQFGSHLLDWFDVVKAVKQDGIKRGYPVPCYGNQGGGRGIMPFALAIGQFNDAIQLEEGPSVSDTIPNCSMMYKVAHISGQGRKPVWVRGAVHDGTKQNAPCLNPLFWEAHFAEGLANNGVRDISFGLNAPWTGGQESLDYIDSPEVRQVWKDYSQLVDGNRAVFTNRESMANVALVYSMPSLMFRNYWTLEVYDGSHCASFEEAGDWLDSLHVPYDCVAFGHPEIFLTQVDQLKRYKVLILPAVDAMSDTQIALIREFVKRGGKVLRIGETGTRDENLNIRKGEYALSGVSMVDIAAEKQRAERILREADPVKMTLPKKVVPNVWLSANGASYDLHLVNYGADLKNNKLSDMQSFTVSVQLPAGFRFDTVQMLQYRREPQLLKYKMSGDAAVVTVPAFGSYAVISFADKARLDAENAKATQRRYEDREQVKKLAKEKNLY